MSVAQARFHCEFLHQYGVTGSERMSETPDVSMDLLELEDAGVHQPNIESVFLKRKVKKSLPLRKTMWSGPRS